MAHFRLQIRCAWTGIGKCCSWPLWVCTNWFMDTTCQRPPWNGQQSQKSPLGKCTGSSINHLQWKVPWRRRHLYIMFTLLGHFPAKSQESAKMVTWHLGPRAALVPVFGQSVAGAIHSSLLATSLEWICKSNTLRPSIFYTCIIVHAHTHTHTHIRKRHIKPTSMGSVLKILHLCPQSHSTLLYILWVWPVGTTSMGCIAPDLTIAFG